MSLLNFKDWFHPKQAEQIVEPSQQLGSENGVRYLDQELANHHQILEKQTSAAIAQPVASGSTIPPIETSPLVSPQAVNTDPMQVIMAGPQNANDTAKVVDIMTPESFKSSNTGAVGDAVGSTFGKDIKENLEQILNGKSYRTTESPIDFLAAKNKREQDMAAMKQQVEEELEKAS